MPIFNKETSPARIDARAQQPAEAALSIIASGMKIVGDIETTGVVKIDGQINGSVTGARQVLLGRGGSVHGNVLADEVVLAGAVNGCVVAAERLELQGTSSVNGDIETRSIIVLEGARINGGVRMGDSVSTQRSAPEPLRIASSS
jgi:cytoskeletal protein CcmA (bactofilin family)